MNTEYILTIAIPTFNRKDALRKALMSIEANNISDRIEVIVSDNASTDGTKRMMEEFKWVKYYENDINLGFDRNFMNCYDKANGNYVWLLGSDDILTSNAVNSVLDFLDSNGNLGLIYLNNLLFVEKNGHYYESKPYYSGKNNRVLNDQNEFISVTRGRITFISCMILRKELVYRVSRPEDFFGTAFIHTCIYFESMYNSGFDYGIVSDLCVKGNFSEGDATLDKDVSRYLEVFSANEKYVYCDLGVKYGYSEKLMKHIFINDVRRNLTTTIIKAKARGLEDISETFWGKVYPAVKSFPSSWFTIFPAYLMPRGIARLLLNAKSAITLKR